MSPYVIKQISRTPKIVAKITTEPRNGLPWKRGFRYNVFSAELTVEGHKVEARGIWRESPREAVAEALSAWYQQLLHRQLPDIAYDINTRFADQGMHSINDGSAIPHHYWIIDSTHEEAA